jgi:pSer/pThr/pTyr-binding forkhead associated (FHA) protein
MEDAWSPITEFQEPPRAGAFPENVFLIHQMRTVPVAGPVVNLGRRFGNELVLDDMRVSRAHAQLRYIGGRFILFDLDSSGGTFINGQRITQSVLYSGDVISLAGVEVIFKISDDVPRPDLRETDRF